MLWKGLASLLYGLARGKLAPIMIVAGGAVEKAAGYLYFIYLLLYVVSDVLFIAGWNLAPSLALVYLVVEKYHGSLFYVALVEASISLATIVGTYIEERIRRFSGYTLLSLGTATEALALAGIVFSPPVIAYLLVLAFVIRLGDTLVFIGRREWLFNSISREEASLVTSLVSSIRRGIGIVSGLATGLLASLSPVAPYVACLVLMLLTLLIYAVARRLEAAG
ncbi:hypothetical protein Pyrde_1883 [Pyrodictium delaneyi]|uniref:MFS transporter n=2 Tax=Pyrodictium delaneyi TaxID=1273541 RepID=A0A0P0N562_9CREN|nr:hypothetical protein [Pyrodictium delaneyi]ALL01926.1 hypothetical protein Pyrde_1883 [Pyrodictium delaneyi]